MQKKKRKPNIAAGRLALGMSLALTVLLFSVKSNFGDKCFAAASALMAWSWGSQEVAAAKKWKRKLEDERKTMSVEERLESERLEKAEESAPVTGFEAIFTWVLLSVTLLLALAFGLFMLFHHQR